MVQDYVVADYDARVDVDVLLVEEGGEKFQEGLVLVEGGGHVCGHGVEEVWVCFSIAMRI